jgi:hypothetical protein
MNEINTQQILTEFPEFFKHKDNLQASLMMFGFEYSDGWYDLTYYLCKDIEKYFLTKDERHKIPETFYVEQCKEKFGGLRFYVSSAPKEVFDMIHKAEGESFKICEICGKKGKLRTDLAWYLTLCREHYKERMEKNGKG